MRLNPEIFIVEDADSFAWTGRQYQSHKCLMREGFPGAKAHVENPGRTTEQERPINNRVLVNTDAGKQGKTGVSRCQRFMGVGLSHSSAEYHEGGVS
jgi:hypothetical protein